MCEKVKLYDSTVLQIHCSGRTGGWVAADGPVEFEKSPVEVGDQSFERNL